MKFRPPMTSMAVNVCCSRVLRIDHGPTTAANAMHNVNEAQTRLAKGAFQKSRINSAKKGGDSQITLRVNAPSPSNAPVTGKPPISELCSARTADQQAPVSKHVNSTSLKSRSL